MSIKSITRGVSSFGGRYWVIVILLSAFNFSYGQKSVAENDLKKKAEKYFNDQKYSEAVPLYSQLLSVYPQNGVYNYRYGVCILISGKDKSQAVPYLEAAEKLPNANTDVYFYLGRAYMVAGHYHEALAKFDEFKKTGGASRIKALYVDSYISNCTNAIELNKDRRNITIIDGKETDRSTFYTSYDFDAASGKLLTTTDRFLTQKDKEMKNQSVMFMSKEGNTIFFSSYGKKGESGKDIYKIIKLANGEWSDAINLGGVINTLQDEDYPYLDSDNKTLYFSSKGFNSIGGYDLFKSEYDFNTGRWSAPVNLGIPVNTIDDDFLFVPTLAGDEATYSTAVESQAGKIEMRHIRLSDVVSRVAIIKGVFSSKDEVMRKDARITVLRESNHDIVSSTNTNPRTGEYELVLPPGGDYILVVEGGSYLPHAENFSLPGISTAVTLKQKVVMDRKGNTERMTLNNFFQQSTAEATTASEKPSEVKESTINLQQQDTTVIKPVIIDGKSVYVYIPPVTVERMASQNNDLDKNDSGTSNTEPTNDNKTDSLKDGFDEITKQDDVADVTENKVVSTSSKDKIKNTQSASPEKVTNNQLVRMGFDDAYSLREEASAINEQQLQKQVVADSLDRISKEQFNKSEQLILTDKDESVRLSDESKANAMEAQNKRTESFAMKRITQNKEKEADRAFSQASQLMTQLKVDTNSADYKSTATKYSVSPGLDEMVSDKNAESDENIEPSLANDNQTESSAQTINNASDTKKDKKDKNDNENTNETAMNPHLENANRLQAESEAFASQAYEKNQAALSTSDKKQKAELLKEAKELKKESQLKKEQSEKEVLFAEKEERTNRNVDVNKKTAVNTENRGEEASEVPINEHDERAKELKRESFDLALQTDEINQKALITTDKKEKANLLNESKRTKKLSIAKRKEADKEVMLARKSEKAQPSSDINKPSAIVNAKVNENSKEGKADERTVEAAAQKDNNFNEEQSNSLSKANEKSDERKSEELALNKEYRQDNETVGVNSVAPEAAEHYQNYKSKNESSDRAKRQAEAIELKMIIADENERDSLVSISNELSKQSILEWQEGQKELAQAKAIDPFVEDKMDIGFTDTVGDISENKNREAENASTTYDVRSQGSETKPVDNNAGAERRTANPEPNSVPVANELSSANSSRAGKKVETLDTTRAEYPQYLEVQQQIQEKQDETVNVFIEGMQVNKRAIAEREEEMKIRDRAEVQTDSKKKEKLVIQADSVKAIGDSLTQLSQDKLALAQQNTQRVKSLQVKSDELKSKLYLEEPLLKPDEAIALADEQENRNANENPENQRQAQSKQKSTTQEENSFVTPDGTTDEKSISEPDMTEKPDFVMKSNSSSASPVSESNSLDQTNSRTAEQTRPIIPADYLTSDVKTFSRASSNVSNDIPMDTPLPEGLVFKVQIGAFRTPLSPEVFGNLQPLTGETSRPGWIRYCLGLFRSFEPANLLKKEVRGTGYRDAFVVAYFNGKRISLSEAYQMVERSTEKEKLAYASVSEMEFKQLAKFNITSSKVDQGADQDSKSFYGTTESVSGDLIEYTVQVGAYKTARVPSALNVLLPLNSERTATGLYRFTTGRFQNYSSADSMKKVAVGAGVKDAFIVVYRGGAKMTSQAATAFLRKGKSESPKNETSTSIVNQPTVTSTTPASPANEATLTDISFKIQLGAFKETVPTAMVNSFLQLADKGITQEVDSRGLHIYYAGQYQSYENAVAEKGNAIEKGIKDAFIVAFANGKRISIAEALDQLKK